MAELEQILFEKTNEVRGPDWTIQSMTITGADNTAGVYKGQIYGTDDLEECHFEIPWAATRSGKTFDIAPEEKGGDLFSGTGLFSVMGDLNTAIQEYILRGITEFTSGAAYQAHMQPGVTEFIPRTNHPLARMVAAVDALRPLTDKPEQLDPLLQVLICHVADAEQPKKPIVAVNAAIIRDGCILMIYRPEYGQWGLPGGKYELEKERQIAALKREVRQETGLGIKLVSTNESSLLQKDPGTLVKTEPRGFLIAGTYFANYLPNVFADPVYAFQESIGNMVGMPGQRTIYWAQGIGDIADEREHAIVKWLPLDELHNYQYEPNTFYFLREQAVIAQLINLLPDCQMSRINNGVVFKNNSYSIYVQNQPAVDNRNQHIDIVTKDLDFDLLAFIKKLPFEVKSGPMRLDDNTPVWRLCYNLPFLSCDSKFPEYCEK